MGLLIFDLVWPIKDFGGGELDEYPIFWGRKAHREDWIRLLMKLSAPWRLSVSAGSRVTFGVWMPRMSYHRTVRRILHRGQSCSQDLGVRNSDVVRFWRRPTD